MPKVDLSQIEQTNRTQYPEPFATDVAGRFYRRLAPSTGLKDIGVSHVVLQPGAWSSQRHWHNGIDEFLVMLFGEAVLIDDDGETVLRAGDCAAFPTDGPNGHHLVTRGDQPCAFLAFDCQYGEGDCHYPDIDLHYDAATGKMAHKDGSAY